MTTPLGAGLVLATCSAAWSQQAPALPSDGRPLRVEIRATDPLLEGHGHAQDFRVTSVGRSTLHVWARAASLDPRLRIEDGQGAVLKDDDDSGGGTTAFVRVAVEPGRTLTIRVAAGAPDELGPVELVALEWPRADEESLARIEVANAQVAECRRLWKERQADAARAEISAAVTALIGLRDAHPELGGSPEVVDALWLAGAAAWEAQDLPTSRAAWAATREARERVLPDEHPDLQRTRQNLAVVIGAMGDSPAARVLKEQVLAVYARTLPEDHRDLQQARGNLALTIKDLGDLHGARALEEQVLDVFTRTLPDEHADLQRARLNLGGTLRVLGELDGARALEEKVLEVWTRTLPDDDPNLQFARGNLASTLSKLGDLAGARALQEQVLAIGERNLPARHPALQHARRGLAGTLVSMGDVEGARALQAQMLEALTSTLPADHPEIQALRLNMAILRKRAGDLAGARELEAAVLAVFEATLPDAHFEMQLARRNLGDTLQRLGDLDGARALKEKVVEVYERTRADDDAELQQARQNLARTIALASARLGTAPDAVAAARESCMRLARAFTRGSHANLARAIASSSSREAADRVAWQSGALDLSLSFASGCGLFEPDPALERDAFLLSEGTRGAAQSAAHLARRAAGDPRYAALRARARAASDALAALVHGDPEPSEIAAARAQLDAAQRELELLAGTLGGTGAAFLQPALASFAARVGRDEALIAYRRYGRYTIQPGEHPEQSVTASLCAFVLRWEDSELRLRRVELGPLEPVERAVGAWRDSIGAPFEREDRVDAAAVIEGTTAEPARGLDTPGVVAARDDRAGAELRALVFDPLRAALGTVQRVVVVTDDVVNTIALDALPAGDTWTATQRAEGRAEPVDAWRLGDVVQIETRASLVELLWPEPVRGGDAQLLALGDPDYDGARAVAVPAGATTGEPEPTRSGGSAGPLRGTRWETGFRELAATRAEVRGIAACRAQANALAGVADAASLTTVLERGDASRESLFSLAPRARWLHVATHGWFAPDSARSDADGDDAADVRGAAARETSSERVRRTSPMLLSGLALAGANLPAGALGHVPGLVTAEELSTLDLANCELAVLSACETHAGILNPGQGVASLQRALHMAGASAAITSLWSVPDAATQELMNEFYRGLWIEKKSKSVALWDAKSTLRRKVDERGEPSYATRDWAAWVLTGDPR